MPNLQRVQFVQVPNLKRVMIVQYRPLADRLHPPLESMGRYEVALKKPEKKPVEVKGSKKESDDTRVPP